METHETLESLSTQAGIALFELKCLSEILLDMTESEKNLGCMASMINRKINKAFENVEKCRRIISVAQGA